MDRPVVSLVPSEGQRATITGLHGRPQPVGVICSLATGRHRELLTESAPTLQAYARRHGWDIVLSCESLTTRPPSWAKVALITELMASYEMVFWIDADAIIVDLERDVLAEAGADADIWFARHPQERDPDATVLNAGIILARSSPFARGLFDAMWHETEFIDHNWWENAALLHLLGYSLETPFAQVRESPWHDRVGELDLAWNSVPGYCESPQPAINHHARSDHDNFDRRLASMASDRRAVIERWPAEFGYPANAGQRTHEFVEVPHDTSAGGQPSLDDALRLIDRLDDLNEIQRLKQYELYDLLEDAVNAQVKAERRSDALAVRGAELNEAVNVLDARAAAFAFDRDALRTQYLAAESELAAMRNTKLFRLAQPLRSAYAKVRRR